MAVDTIAFWVVHYFAVTALQSMPTGKINIYFFKHSVTTLISNFNIHINGCKCIQTFITQLINSKKCSHIFTQMHSATQKYRLSKNLFRLVQRIWKIQIGYEILGKETSGKFAWLHYSVVFVFVWFFFIKPQYIYSLYVYVCCMIIIGFGI